MIADFMMMLIPTEEPWFTKEEKTMSEILIQFHSWVTIVSLIALYI